MRRKRKSEFGLLLAGLVTSIGIFLGGIFSGIVIAAVAEDYEANRKSKEGEGSEEAE